MRGSGDKEDNEGSRERKGGVFGENGARCPCGKSGDTSLGRGGIGGDVTRRVGGGNAAPGLSLILRLLARWCSGCCWAGGGILRKGTLGVVKKWLGGLCFGCRVGARGVFGRASVVALPFWIEWADIRALLRPKMMLNK